MDDAKIETWLANSIMCKYEGKFKLHGEKVKVIGIYIGIDIHQAKIGRQNIEVYTTLAACAHQQNQPYLP